MDMCKKGEVDTLIVEELSRLGRNTTDVMIMLISLKNTKLNWRLEHIIYILITQMELKTKHSD